MTRLIRPAPIFLGVASFVLALFLAGAFFLVQPRTALSQFSVPKFNLEAPIPDPVRGGENRSRGYALAPLTNQARTWEPNQQGMDGTSPTEQIHTLVFPALPTTTQDTVREHTDVINAEIRPVEEALHGFRNSVQAKSADEDQLASISLEADATSITEGETVTFTLTRGNSTAGELIVGVTVDDPGGFLKGNYAGEAVEVPSSLVFAPGEITKEVTLTPPDDWRDIPDSTLNFTVDADLGYEIVGSPSSTVQVADNDVAPQVQISFNHGEVDEGEDLVLTITRIGEDKNPLEVEMALGPVGSQTYAVFVIEIGEPHLTTTYNLPDDQFKGPDTHYQVTLHPGDPEFWVPTGATTIYGSILDNDLYTVGVSTLSHLVDEGQLIDYLIFHDGHTGEPLEVNVNRSEIGSAVADSLLSATTHTINAGSSGLNLTIPTTANDGSDGTALFNVEILPGDGYTVDPNHDSVHIAVEDVDPLPVLSLRSGAEVAVSEGIGTVEIWVDLTSTLPVLREVEVDYEILEVATAEDGEDFTASVGTLVFSPGETSKAVEVPILQDNLAEYDERFAVELKNPVFANLEDGQTTLTARVVITDDEPIVSMEAAAAAVNEGFAAIFNLTRKRNTTDELTVWLKVIWSAPEASTTRVSATFPAGHATTQFTVPTKDDKIRQGTRTITTVLEDPDSIGQPWTYFREGVFTQSITVLDDEFPAVHLGSGTLRLYEGEPVEFTVSRGETTNTPLTVSLNVVAPARFTTGLIPSSVTIPAGEESAEFVIQTVDDSLVEDTGELTVTALDSAQYRLKHPSTTTFLIFDNDGDLPKVRVTRAEPWVDEGEDVVFYVNRLGSTRDTLDARLSLFRKRSRVTAADLSDPTRDITTSEELIHFDEEEITVSFPAGTSALSRDQVHYRRQLQLRQQHLQRNGVGWTGGRVHVRLQIQQSWCGCRTTTAQQCRLTTPITEFYGNAFSRCIQIGPAINRRLLTYRLPSRALAIPLGASIS